MKPHPKFSQALLLGLALLTACKAPGAASKKNDLDAALPKTTTIQVQTVTAKAGTLNVQRSVSATISAERDSKVAAQTGGTVQAVLVQEGQSVPAGAAVLQLDDSQQRQALQNAQLQLRQAEISLQQSQTTTNQSGGSLNASVVSAQAALAQAQQKADSAERLYTIGGASLTEVQAARSALAQAQSTLAQAQQNLAQNGKSAQNSVPLQQVQVDTSRAAVQHAQENLDRTTIRAPFAGKVADIAVQVGEFAAQGSTVFRLVDPGSIRAKFSVPASDALALKNGATLNLSYGGKTFVGHVLDSTDIAGTDRLVPIKARIEGGEGLPIGGAAQAVYRTSLGSGVLVPSSALQSGSDGNVVYTVQAGKAVRHAITVNAEAGGQVAVSGISAGEQVISPVLASLQDGAAVQVGPSATNSAATNNAATGSTK